MTTVSLVVAECEFGCTKAEHCSPGVIRYGHGLRVVGSGFALVREDKRDGRTFDAVQFSRPRADKFVEPGRRWMWRQKRRITFTMSQGESIHVELMVRPVYLKIVWPRSSRVLIGPAVDFKAVLTHWYTSSSFPRGVVVPRTRARFQLDSRARACRK